MYVHIGLNFVEIPQEDFQRGTCALLDETHFPVGLRSIQHLLCRIDPRDMRPDRIGRSLFANLARPCFDGPGLVYNVSDFGRYLSETQYNYLLEKLVSYLDSYDPEEYIREMREYISGKLGLLIPMNELEKLYIALTEDNQIGYYFWPIAGRFWETFLKVYDFQHLTPEQLFNPSKKADPKGLVKSLRKIFRESYGAHDFRYKG